MVGFVFEIFVSLPLLNLFLSHTEFTREDDEFNRTLHTAISYVKRYNCPAELEYKVRSWFMYTRSTQKTLEIQRVISFLPRHIQTSLALEINYKILSQVPFTIYFFLPLNFSFLLKLRSVCLPIVTEQF